jgi:hypothetical protein
MAPRNFALLLSVLAAVALACSSGSETMAVAQTPSPLQEAEFGRRFQPDEIPLIKGPVSEEGLQAIFATPDIGVGRNRFAFVLTSTTGLIRTPTATVSSSFFPEDGSGPEPKQTALAIFRPFPLVSRGLYVTRLTFDSPGQWGVEIDVLDDNGVNRTVELSFQVGETTAAPQMGSSAIASRSKTVGDVERLSELSTGSLLDPDLYQLTIAEAVESGLPTVVVMASPAFCTNAVCGPQVEVLQQLKDEFEGMANFIHVDFFDNPEEIQGDLDRARTSPVVVEWNLPSTEWSFVIDRQGVIVGRFESFTTLEELRVALGRVL